MPLSVYSKQARQLVMRYPRLENVPLWGAALATGIVSVLFAEAFNHAEQLSVQIQATPWFYLVAPLCFLISWFVVDEFAPEASGSGIPQVMAAIEALDDAQVERARLERLLGLKTTLIKVVSSVVCVVGGAAIGREGPTIQIAAGIFFLIHTWVRGIFPALNAEAWLVAGGGAGIAAAFNTPLGGLVYAIEELATKHFVNFRTPLISSVMVSGLAALWLGGNYLYFGSTSVEGIQFQDHVYAVILGISGGLAGGLFGLALTYLAAFRKKLTTRTSKACVAIACGFLMVAIVLATGREGSIGPGRSLVLGLLSGKVIPSWDLVLARWLAPVISYFAGGAGGIFAPSLAAGASLGAWVASLSHSAHLDFFILMGMVGFLTGVTHAPFTSLVLMLEMTDRHSAIFPMMLATFAAFVVSRLISHKSFYEIMKEDFYSRVFAPDAPVR
jgi:H+/Cl- antiporter ClcA